MTEPSSLTSTLYKLMQRAIQSAGGWIGFDRFMALALYAPGLGYYANSGAKFGTMPEGVKGEVVFARGVGLVRWKRHTGRVDELVKVERAR